MRADARAVVDTNVLISAALLAGRADVLISGDGDLPDLRAVQGVSILPPARALDLLVRASRP
jgi:predicted nucleic acid-binding protein